MTPPAVIRPTPPLSPARAPRPRRAVAPIVAMRGCLRPLVAGLCCAAAISAASPRVMAMSIEDAVALAVSTHPTVSRSKASMRAAEQEAAEAHAGWFPTFDINADAGWEHSENFFTRNDGESGDSKDLFRKLAGGEIVQNIFSGGRTVAETAAAKARVEAALQQVIDSEEQIALRAATAYLDVLRARHLVRLSEENLTAHLEVRNDIDFKLKRGGSDSGDLNQAEARTALARTRLNRARGQLREAEAAFIEAVGQAPADLDAPRPPDDVVPANVGEAVASAVQLNPLVRAADATIAARDEERSAARASFLPSFDLKLGGAYGDDINGVEDTDIHAQGIVVMNYNLYSGGADTARVRRATERLSEARQRQAEVRRQVEERMRVEYTNLRTARDNLPLSEARARSAAGVVSAYLDQFNIGRRSLLDVLDVVNELFEANVGVVSTDTDIMRASYRVLAILGTLRQTLGGAALTTADADAGGSGRILR
jgi:adhesin transport system outer membrane protein